MNRKALAVFGCFALAAGAVILAYAGDLYTLQDDGITPGGTTGESASYQASTLLADLVESEASSPSYGITVVIPETVIEAPSAVGSEPGPDLRFSLANNYPNPFNPQTAIVFTLPKQAVVRLRVYDVSGRLVRALIAGEAYEPGRHEVVWNGRDDAGRQAASGAYFYRLDAGESSETRRMVLIK